MRAVVVASVVCAVGCRQLLGLDSPSIGTDGRHADSSEAIDGHMSDGVAGSDAPGTTGFVGGTSGNGNGTASGGLTEPATNDVMLVGVAWLGGASVALADSDGNSFVPLDEQAGGSGSLAIYYTVTGSPANSTDTIRAHTNPAQEMAMVAAVYRGITPTDPIDSYIGTSGTGSTVQSPPLLTTNPHDILVALGGTDKPLAAVPPYTQRVQSPLHTMLVEDLDVTTTGSYQASETETSNDAWSIELVGLRIGP